MKKFSFLVVLFLLVGGIGLGWYFISGVGASLDSAFEGDDPDMPSSLNPGISKEEFMRLRSEHIGKLRGIKDNEPFDPQLRANAVKQLENQEQTLAKTSGSSQTNAILAAWTEIGPFPIPNGQVQSGTQLPVSGRTIAIAVHPTNPNIVYVGTAQGGLYRTTDGGATWTTMLDNALSLAVGAVAISPSQPDTIYVGTGEPNFSNDSFFGAGVYRIDNASTAAPTVSAALGTAQFSGRGIGRIVVDPTNPATIFVASAQGVGGISGATPAVLPSLGIYRSTDATAASPTFTKLFPGNSINVRDIAIDPNNANILVANVIAGGGGLFRSVNALSAAPTFALAFAYPGGATFNNLTGEIASVHPAGDTNATFYAATGNNAAGTGTGSVLKSTDGGANWTRINPVTFCNPQCFYDIAIDVDPTNANNVYIGGTGANTFDRSTNGGTTFTPSQANLHTDSHAIAVAPSLPSTIYFGSDGGIYKSVNSGGTWTSLNNTTFRATQFTGLAVHSTDPNYTLGGSQDNGTELQQTSLGNWFRADFGDGGYAVIDQADTSTTVLDLYHTYFNASNLTGYAYVPSTALATEGNWQFRGCQGAVANGITCTATVLFYAPLEQGPGSPNNSIYYGSDRLYRSIDTGLNNATVSQIFTSPISAIGISPQNDNVRILGQSNGGIFGTTTGVATLTDLDPGNTVPNSFVARAVIDPNNVNTAYVTLSAFGITNIWKSTNINAATPTWTAAAGLGGTAVPQVPVNAFIVDPIDSNRLYAGTDIGVYTSPNGGTDWLPFGTGLPRVAVFDMAITSGRLVRIATHGRGMWEISALAPTAASVSISGRVILPQDLGLTNALVTLTDSKGTTRTVLTGKGGRFRFTDVAAGETYIISVSSKRYQFAPQVVTVTQDITELNFTAL